MLFLVTAAQHASEQHALPLQGVAPQSARLAPWRLTFVKVLLETLTETATLLRAGVQHGASQPAMLQQTVEHLDASQLLERVAAVAGQSGNWVLDHSDSFGYDANYDYLTSAAYGDGQANPNQTWIYDPAGNRSISGYSYDNLNRMLTAPSPGTGIGSVSYTNDILGNRLTQSASGETTTTYTWDTLNRLTSLSGASAAAYEYRADGLRTFKSVTTGGTTTTDAYRYDGQMSFEDETICGSTVSATRSALGARGIDAVESASGTISGEYAHHWCDLDLVPDLRRSREPHLRAEPVQDELLPHRHAAL